MISKPPFNMISKPPFNMISKPPFNIRILSSLLLLLLLLRLICVKGQVYCGWLTAKTS